MSARLDALLDQAEEVLRDLERGVEHWITEPPESILAHYRLVDHQRREAVLPTGRRPHRFATLALARAYAPLVGLGRIQWWEVAGGRWVPVERWDGRGWAQEVAS